MTGSGRRVSGPAVWTWISVLGSVVLCGLLSWLHIQQRVVVDRTGRLVNSFRLARLDLTKGFLNMKLAERAGAELPRLQALALLRQALDDLHPEEGPDADGKLDLAESVGRRSFEAALSAFREELEKAATSTALDARDDARLSLRFQELEGKADLLDDLHQKDLRTLRSRLDREFALTLGIAALLLGAACLGVWLAGRDGARATAALRESEERLRLLGDNLPDSYVYQYTREPDGTSKFLYVSAGVERIHGVKPADIVADPGVLLRLFEPDVRGLREAAEVVSARDLSDFTMEVRARRADGPAAFFLLRSRPWKRPDGRVIWDGVATDVTERRLAEEALRESEERLRKLVATLSHGVVLFELTSRRLEWNPAALEILGLPPPARGALVHRRHRAREGRAGASAATGRAACAVRSDSGHDLVQGHRKPSSPREPAGGRCRRTAHRGDRGPAVRRDLPARGREVLRRRSRRDPLAQAQARSGGGAPRGRWRGALGADG